MIRVIAGEFRGRKIKGPPRLGIRPMMGIVKEHVFGVLQQRIVDASVLDLFSGTGSVGIEALSRGAAHVTFVDTWRVSLKLVEDNLSTLSAADRADVVAADAVRFLETYTGTRTYDIIFVDPPFKYEQWPDVLAPITGVMSPEETTLVLQHLPDISESTLPEGLERVRHKKFGASQVSMFRYYPE
jgi:16S rRNA (guanine966-N2)-methyltransferase